MPIKTLAGQNSLAGEGHSVAWEFDSPGGAYTGRILIDGAIYTTAEATRAFLCSTPK